MENFQFILENFQFIMENYKSFDENINYNFAYSNCWSSRIADAFEIDEFEKSFKLISQYFQKAEKGGDDKK